jgi:hypothetical protein
MVTKSMEVRQIGGVESIFPDSYEKTMANMGNDLVKLALKMHEDGRLKLKCDEQQEPASISVPEVKQDAVSERA